MRAISSGDGSDTYSIWLPLPAGSDFHISRPEPNVVHALGFTAPIGHVDVDTYLDLVVLRIRRLPSLDTAIAALSSLRSWLTLLSVKNRWPFLVGTGYATPLVLESHFPPDSVWDIEGREEWSVQLDRVLAIDWQCPSIYREGDRVVVNDFSVNIATGTRTSLVDIVRGLEAEVHNPLDASYQLRIGAWLFARASALGDPIRCFLDAFTVVDMLTETQASEEMIVLVDRMLGHLERDEARNTQEGESMRARLVQLKSKSMRQALFSITQRCVDQAEYTQRFRALLLGEGETPRQAADTMYALRNKLVHDTMWTGDLLHELPRMRRLALLVAEYGLKERLRIPHDQPSLASVN